MFINLEVSDNPRSLYLNYLDLIDKCHRYDVKWVYADIEHNVGHDTSFGNHVRMPTPAESQFPISSPRAT
jgi:hypothetical protein